MSTRSIDERIVDMQFNNRQFESGIKESLGSIDRLKKGLDFKDAEKSFDGLSSASSKFSLAGIADGVSTIASKFTALGVIGVTALMNITNAAVDAGIALVKSLTIDQVTAGWDKYGQKMASVQTIMNSTGLSIEEVNTYLDKLMWFSDETSYGFTDMTTALGQMTSSGGEIGTLVPMIMGVANATAFAGKGVNEFSRAMYNLNQSYGSGFLQYMDWKSLELAGVASKELKQTFIDVGVALGKIKEGEVTIANFGATLKDKWADTEVMEAAFGKFGEMTELAYQMVQSGEVNTASEAYEILAQRYTGVSITAAKAAQEAKTLGEAIAATKDAVSSGWMNTFEIIFGDYVEAKKLWTDLANAMWEVFAAGAEVRNEMLLIWKDEGGRDALIQSFWNLWEAIEALVKPIKEAFQEIFPPMTGKRLAEMTKSFEKFTEKLKIGDETAAKIKSTFKGLFALVSIGKEFFSALIRGIGDFIKLLIPAGKDLLTFSGSIGDWLVNLNAAIKKSDFFTKAFEKVKTFLSDMAVKMKEAFGKMREAIEEFTGLDLTSIGTFIESLKEKFHPIQAIGEFLKKAFDFIKDVFKKVGPVLATVGKKIGEAIKSLNLTGLVNLFATGGFAAIIIGIKKLIDSFREISDKAGGFLEGITDILDGVKDSLKAYQNDLKAGTLLKIAGAIAILAGSLFLLSTIDTSKLTGALLAITTLFAELFGSIAIFETSLSKKGGFSSMTKVAIGMILLSTAVLILAKALSELAKNDIKDMAVGLLAIGGIIAMLVAAAKILSTTSGGLLKASIGFIALGIAVKLLASAVTDLANIDLDKLINGMIGLLGILAMLSLFMMATKEGAGLSIGDAVGLLAVGLAVKLLATSIESLGKLDPKVLGKGLLAITLVLAELVIFVNAVNTGFGLIGTAIGIAILGASLMLFAKAVERFGQMPFDPMIQGLLAIGVTLIFVAGAMNLMPPNMVGIGIGLLAVSVGLLLIASAIEKAGDMEWEEIAKGLVALGGALILIVAAVNLMTGALAGAAALLIVSAALLGLAFVMKILGSMSLEEIGIALLSIVGVIAILGVSALALGPVIPLMLGLGAALLLLGIGLLAVGGASIVLGIGLAVLAGAGTDGIAILLLLAEALVPLTLLSPGMLLVGAGLLVLAVGLLAVGAGLTVLGLGLGILMALGPAGNQALIDMANTAAQISEFALQILAAGAALLVFGVGALVAGAGALIAGIGILVLAAGLAELAKVDISNMEGIVALGGDLFTLSGQLLLATPGLLAGGAALVVFGSGALTTGEGLASITAGMTDVMEVVKSIPDDISEATTAIINGVNNLIDQVTRAISSHEETIVGTITTIMQSCVSAINSYAGAFSAAGANVASGFVSSIRDHIADAAAAAADMAKAALDAANEKLKIKSPSRAFGETAKNSILGFVNKFREYTPLAMAAASDMGRKVLDPVFTMSDSFVIGAERAGAGLQKMAEKAMGMTPTIIEEKDTTVHHTFDPLHVEGVNDKGEFVGAADYSVEKVLTAMMRRQSRI